MHWMFIACAQQRRFQSQIGIVDFFLNLWNDSIILFILCKTVSVQFANPTLVSAVNLWMSHLEYLEDRLEPRRLIGA